MSVQRLRLTSTTSFPRTAFDAALRFLGRIRGQSLRPPSAPGERRIGYVFESGGAVAAERVLISFLGPLEPKREAQIEAAAKAVEADGRQPVIVANDLPIQYLVASSRPVELLPTREQLGVLSGNEYEAYLRRRWAILRAKWSIRRDIVLGEPLEGFLASQLGHEQPKRVT